MPVKFDADEFDKALRQFKRPRPAPAPNLESGTVPIADKRDQSEEFKVRLIMARTKLKLMRDRSDSLRESLQRFRDQQGLAKRA